MFAWLWRILGKQPLQRQTCPRRMYEWGPWGREAGQDLWETNRWNHRRHWSGAEYQAGKKLRNIGPKRKTWHLDWIPRSCSFCGSIHPEDALRLLEEFGWEVEPTDKAYKRYLHPAGYYLLAEQHFRKLTAAEEAQIRNLQIDIFPTVKLYTMHLSAEQVERFNAAITTYHARREAEKRASQSVRNPLS